MRKTCSIFICICLMLLSFAPSAFAIDKGDGTEQNPYQVSTLDDLKAVADNLSAYYIQTADIDASGENAALISGSFTGHYNGNGKKITFNTTEAGFAFSIFRIIEAGGVVENLYTEGTIAGGQNSIAPIVYSLLGTVRNCHNSADVTSTQTYSDGQRGNVGGIAAFMGKGAVIENCTNSGDLSAQDYVGGIVSGVNYSAVDYAIRNCSSTGNLTASKLFAGGIVGAVTGSVTGSLVINNCHSSGNIQAGSYAGGIIGGLNQNLNGTLDIRYCSSSADVTATTDYAGGIFGASAYNLTDGTINITRCYATGKISATTSAGGMGACFVVVNTTKTSANITGNYFAGTLSGGRIGAMVGTPFVNNRTGTINIAISRNYSTAPAVSSYQKMAGYNSTSTSGTAKWSCPTASNFILKDGTSTLSYASAITAEELSDADTFYAKYDTLSDYFDYDIGDRTDKYPYPQFASNPHNAPGTVLIPVTFICGENGTVSKKDGYVTSGDTVSVKIQPNDGYIISSVLCGEAPAVIQDVSGFTYQTSPLAKNTAITVAFETAPVQTPEIVSDVKWNYVPSGETASGNITFGKVTGEEAKITDYGIIYSASNAVPLLDGDDCITFSARNYGGKSANGFYGVSLTGSVLNHQQYYTRTYVTYTDQDGLPHTEYGVVITVDLRK